MTPPCGSSSACRRRFPTGTCVSSSPPAVYGTNLKVSNLINMMPTALHPCIVLADSDIAVPPDYLLRIAAALDAPGIGAVTCLYHGVAGAGLWSKLSALAIDGHFLPNVLVGLRSGLAKPCFGSTIALRRSHLEDVGGFAAFADCLADDYAIGAALREKGLEIAVPRFLVGHSCAEALAAGIVAPRAALGAHHPHRRSARLCRFAGHAPACLRAF